MLCDCESFLGFFFWCDVHAVSGVVGEQWDTSCSRRSFFAGYLLLGGEER